MFCIFPCFAQQQLSKKECKQVMTGIWQMTGQRKDGKSAYAPTLKMYLADGTYLFTSQKSALSPMYIAHEGKWRIVKPGVMEEKTTYRIDRPNHKGEKAQVQFEVIDENHMNIIWRNDFGVVQTEHYTRVSK